MDFNAEFRLLITYSVFRQILQKKWEKNELVYQLFIDFKKAYDSVSRYGLCNIFIEFNMHMKLARLIKMCLIESYSIFRAGKYFSDKFPIKNGLKQDDLTPFIFKFALE